MRWSRLSWVLRAGLLGWVAACGGARADSSEPPNLALIAMAEVPPRAPAPKVRPQVQPSTAPAPPAPPADALQEAAEHSTATRKAFEARYPLHGIAFHVLSHVRAAPDARAAVIGYMRRGARFRAAAVKGKDGCTGRWFELSAGGFVCGGSDSGYIVKRMPPAFEPAPAPPNAFDALPYPYRKTMRAGEFQFWRVPEPQELDAVAEVLAALGAEGPSTSTSTSTSASASASTRTTTTTTTRGSATGADAGVDGGADEESPWPDVVRMPMEPGFYVSVDRSPPAEAEQAEGYIRTVRGALVREEALTPVEPPPGMGVALGGERELPVAFVHRGTTSLWHRDARSGALERAGDLPLYASRGLSGERAMREGRRYLGTRDGYFVDERLVRVARKTAPPPEVPAGARWLHITLSTQTLVAYEGRVPQFATLVSTGKPGHETPTGVFRIAAKHISTTMDGLAGTDEAYSIEDVPWTMYFKGSFALHAAFWHHRFGHVRSHGCVNLAPDDARWLFNYTTPELPAGWHGVVAELKSLGTWVAIEA